MELLHDTIDPTAITRQIEAMIAGNRTAPARHLLAAVRRLTPETPELALLSARLAIRDGRHAEAMVELDAAIAATPDNANLYKARASLRSDLHDTTAALQDAAEAVLLDRHDNSAKALLGVLLLELGAADEARQCLTEAVRTEPENPFYCLGLARAQEACGAHDAAVETLDAAIAAIPARTDLRTEAVLLHIRQRRFATALHMAEAARRAGLADACLFGLKAHALSSLERHDEAAEAYNEALKLGPNDPYVRHIVAAAGLRPGAPRAPAEYLRAVFDGYADRFEQHLISLSYRVPGLIRTAVMRHFDIAPSDTAMPRVGPVLDLGCGTGLLALVLADLPLGPFTGIDLSTAMLAEARAKALYADLREADILTVLADDPTQWPVILAGDVLCYFGALDDLFDAVKNRLKPGGAFVFSIETNTIDTDWRLSPQGRYSHNKKYIEKSAAASGLHIRELVGQTIRFEAAMPVAGMLVVLEHPSC
jgi:predicted TPR repeat methyltransferase